MGVATWIFSALLSAGSGPQAAGSATGAGPAYPIRVEEMPRPVAGNSYVTEEGPILSVADWGGLRFLQYDTLTYWTADGGVTWKHRVWMAPGSGKGPYPSLPDARFKSTGPDLFLDGGGAVRSLAVFDPIAGGWKPVAFGDPAFADITAMACDTDRIYVYSSLRGLWLSRDRGASFTHIPVLGDSLDPASAFDRIEAEGSRLLLGRKRSGPRLPEAVSLDGGKTWTVLPAPWEHRLFEGCLQWVAAGRLRSQCDPDGTQDSAAVPFNTLSRLFRQEGGALFAFADSGLYHYAPATGWEAAGMPPAWEGWIVGEEVMSARTVSKVAWISGGRPMIAALSIRSQGRRAGPLFTRLPAWLRQGRRPDGRALARPAF